MSKFACAAALAALAVFAAPATLAFATDEPAACEDMLKDVKAAVKTATLSDADKATVADLQQQGTDLCKADDDAAADEFFAKALKLLGK